MIRVHPAWSQSAAALRLPPSSARHVRSVARWLLRSVVSNRVEYAASLDQIWRKRAKCARTGRDRPPASWMAAPMRVKAVTLEGWGEG